jgi:SprT protein
MLNWPESTLADSRYERMALQRTQRLLNEAATRYNVTLPLPEVRFDLRGKAAGMVLFRANCHAIIRYNRILLNENGNTFIERTVPHEVAHLVAREVHGPCIKPHGEQWRAIMAFFGADSSRCHSFPVKEQNRRRMRYFHYRCGCQDHRLSAIRHHRHLAGVTYLCRRCGSALRWVFGEDG